uniref:Ephrin RBD domain-containing protein n=1 Tax=Timema douglasi TaxID=61478 RepID=A0A7R8Z696_TIMDO|nr:unnamed protein product [Timema douglasi]
MLDRVMQAFVRRLEECVAVNGKHLLGVIFRNFRIDNTDHIIDVNKGNIPFEYDQVNIICPVYMPGTHEEDAEKYIIYNVSKEEYDTCRITNPNPRIIAICDKPYKLMYFTITFRSFTPQPGGLEFQPGQDYYFISTSSKDDLHRRIGGRCSSHNMKVVFKVCCRPDLNLSPIVKFVSPGARIYTIKHRRGEDGKKGGITFEITKEHKIAHADLASGRPADGISSLRKSTQLKAFAELAPPKSSLTVYYLPGSVKVASGGFVSFFHAAPVNKQTGAACDPFLKFKLAFCKTIVDECQPFLQRFQTSKPMTPYLFEAVAKLLRYLMNRETAITVTERQKLECIHECRSMLTTMIAKLQERSPLKQKAVRGLSSLDPCVIQHSPQLGQKRFSFLLEELNHANIINDVLAENAKKEYLHFCNLKKSQFRPCDQFSDESNLRVLQLLIQDYYHKDSR